MRAITHALGSVIAPLWPAAGGGIRILGYHAVGTVLPFTHYGISIDPEAWRAQMTELATACNVVPLAAAGRIEGPSRIAVTLDDGYRDALTVVAPFLRDLGIPATVFVTTDFMSKADGIHLTPREVKELATVEGIEIGSHGVSHRRLTECDDAALARELRDSRAILEDIVGRAVVAVAYPHGAVDARVRDAAAAAGYDIGCTTRYGINRTGRDRLLLCRTEVLASDSFLNFRQKLRGAWDWYGHRRRDVAR